MSWIERRVLQVIVGTNEADGRLCVAPAAPRRRAAARLQPRIRARPPAERAFHQAGHAVVALYFDLSFSKVTIAGVETLWIDFPIDTPAERRLHARQRILVCYAGLEAARLVRPDAAEDCGEGDRLVAMALAREYALFPRRLRGHDGRQEFLERLRGEARRLVQHLREPIRVLANKLLRRQTIFGCEAERAIRHLVQPRIRSGRDAS